eukprot:1159946-Pelagomonas_calceolata.AAC.13
MHSDPRVHLLIPSSVPIESQLSEREPRIMVVYFLFWDYKTSGGWILERKGKGYIAVPAYEGRDIGGVEVAQAVLEGGFRKGGSEFIKRNSLHGDTAFRPAYSEEFGGREGIDSRGGQAYAAAAMSLVFHSAHPHIPTLRADVRLFQGTWNIGLVFDRRNKHNNTRELVFEHARGEHRGIGGLFFDDMEKGTEGASSKGGFDAEAFTRDVGKGILDSWVPIAGGWAGEQ